MTKKNPRYIIFTILYSCLNSKKSFNLIFNHTIQKYPLESSDIAFILNISKGVFRERRILDENIFLYSKSKKIDKKSLVLLYIGTYQLLYCNSIPNYASINTTVDLAKIVAHNSSSFINAILRRISKTPYNVRKSLKVESPDIYYSYPKWILDKLYKTYNKKAYSICETNATQPFLWFRINQLKITPDDISEIFNKNKIVFSQDITLSNYFKVKKFDKAGIILDLINQGNIYVQNPSSAFVVNLLNPKENDMILDACSAPGGKSAFMVELCKENIDLTCLDIDQKRLNMTKDNLDKLGLSNINYICADATVFKTNKKYNKILLDLPCTSSGTIRKNPDLKWKINTKDINDFQKLQYNILDNMKNNLLDGGEIIYSTCSIFDEENNQNIIKFIKNNSNFTISKINNKILNLFKNKIGGITILPDINDYEGMFAVKIKRNA